MPLIYPVRQSDGSYYYSGSRDAFWYEDRKTGKRYWVPDWAMKACADMRTEEYQKEGESPSNARRLGEKDAHDEAWTTDEYNGAIKPDREYNERLVRERWDKHRHRNF